MQQNKQLTINYSMYELSELTPEDRELVDKAMQMTEASYAPYSNFHVGAALRLENGVVVGGCNQENAVLPAGVCAERSAIFSAGAQYPDQAVTKLAIAARAGDGKLTEQPVSPCGICRQVMVETETRFQQPMRILLYGETGVYVIDGIKELMPLAFTEF